MACCVSVSCRLPVKDPLLSLNKKCEDVPLNPQAVFLLIGKTSALTMNIAGVIKDWMLIFFSYYLFGAPVTAVNLLGYAFCCSGVSSPLARSPLESEGEVALRSVTGC